MVLITSKAKYKNVQSIDLASGTINYTPADIDIAAIYQENDAGEYDSVNTAPTSGYVLNNTSYCNANGEKDTSIKITYENGLVGISDITKRTKCTLYFDKYSAIDTIIGDTINIEEKTEFTGIATEEDTGIYSAPDDYGTSYYFRGLEGSLNNWVKFAGFYWRIIRINGNGTIRMIYQGAVNGNVSSSNKTGTTTQINNTTHRYNSVENDNTYVGYMNSLNGSGNTTSYNQAHSNLYDSNAKIEIDKWYKNNLKNNTEYDKHIDLNTGFCNDRQISKEAHLNYQGDGYGIQDTGYAPYGRLSQKSNLKKIQIPTFECTNKDRDLFTVSSANIGNKKLLYSIGLITSDEAIFSGGFLGPDNKTFYLYTNSSYWTMSPYTSTRAAVFCIDANGFVGPAGVSINMMGLRPVINLRSDTKFTYNSESTKGSETDPFVVV